MSNKINIEQLEEYLKQAGLENGKLEEVLSPIKELNNQRRYGLVWEEPDNSTYGTDLAEQDLLKNFPFLKEVNEHRIFNGEQYPDHLLIEGDNLHALKTMQYTHKNKIDVIYIDPPYNTGNTDFVYNDKYVDNEDSWRHSKWLSFMNKRLRLARELMTDEGVIFISIDDNEMAQLKLLCDQVFGEQNFVANMSVHSNPGGNKEKYIEKTLQYCLVYAKTKQNLDSFGHTIEIIDKKYKLSDEYGKYKKGYQLEKWGNDSTVKTHPRLAYSIYYNPKTEDVITKFDYNLNEIIENRNSEFKYEEEDHYLINRGYVCIRPRKIDGDIHGRWRLEESTFRKRLNNSEFIFEKQSAGYKIYEKDRFNDKKFIKSKDFINSEVGQQKNELKEIFGESVFDYPKPLNLLTHLLRITNKPNAIVLDFFAGSGTTAHAVMELNKEDGGNRQAIVITNNEINSSEEEDFLVEKGYVEPFAGSRRGTKKHAKWLESINEFKETPEYKELTETDEYKDLGIARAVTEQRINKVINGYTTPKGKEVEGLDNNNFYHFEIVLEPDLLDGDLNTYMLINKTKDIIKVKEDVYANEVDISTDNTPAINLVNDEKEVIVVLSVRVAETDIEQLINNFTGSDKEHIIYTSYTGFEYGINNIRFEELPKELLQAIKHNENN